VVHEVEELPASVRAGEWVVVGDCEALYLETGVPVGFLPMGHWRPVEQTGVLTARVRVGAGTRGLVAELPDGDRVARIHVGVDEQGRTRLTWDGRPERLFGAPFDLGRAVDLTITADPYIDQLVVRAGRRVVLEGLYLGTGGIAVKSGRRLAGDAPTVCRELLRSAKERGRVR
jgi:hypothetical protein